MIFNISANSQNWAAEWASSYTLKEIDSLVSQVIKSAHEAGRKIFERTFEEVTEGVRVITKGAQPNEKRFGYIFSYEKNGGFKVWFPDLRDPASTIFRAEGLVEFVPYSSILAVDYDIEARFLVRAFKFKTKEGFEMERHYRVPRIRDIERLLQLGSSLPNCNHELQQVPQEA